MGRVFYLSLLDVNPSVLPYSGVMKKILLHIEAFRSYGNEVDYIETDEKNIYFVSEDRHHEIGRYCSSGYLYYNRLYKYATSFIRKHNLHYDYIYIRHSALSPIGYLGLRYLHRISNKIYLEFPTYSLPHKNIKNFVKFYYNKKLKRYVHKAVVDSNDLNVYDMPTVRIINGTDLRKIEKRMPTPYDGTINVVLVAYLQGYHGVEKIFSALEEYYKDCGERNVFFHIVGYGPKLEEYINKTIELGLNNHIHFYGKLAGKELDDVFNACEIGISSLANKEVGVVYSSTLKSKEYLAKGLPILSDVMLDVFYNNPKYYFHELKQDFNIPELIKFYDSVYDCRDRKEIIDEIREFANYTCDMFKVLKQIDDDYHNSI